jgi:hypothetical protein
MPDLGAIAGHRCSVLVISATVVALEPATCGAVIGSVRSCGSDADDRVRRLRELRGQCHMRQVLLPTCCAKTCKKFQAAGIGRRARLAYRDL